NSGFELISRHNSQSISSSPMVCRSFGSVCCINALTLSGYILFDKCQTKHRRILCGFTSTARAARSAEGATDKPCVGESRQSNLDQLRIGTIQCKNRRPGHQQAQNE